MSRRLRKLNSAGDKPVLIFMREPAMLRRNMRAEPSLSAVTPLP